MQRSPQHPVDAVPLADPPRGDSLLLVAIGGLLVVFALLVWAWTTINPIIRDVGRIEDHRLPNLDLIARVKYADMAASLALRNALLMRAPELTSAEMKSYEDNRLEASAALESLRKGLETSGAAKLLASVLVTRAELESVRGDAIARTRLAKPDATIDKVAVDLQRALDNYLDSIQGLYEYEGTKVSSSVATTRKQANWTGSLLVMSGAAAGVTLLLLALTWRSQIRKQVAERDRQISRLHEQRGALVREVHHRIKNHLHGLLGLIEGFRETHPGVGQELATLHGHVLALMGIHGIQSRQAGESVSLGELVRQQVKLIEAGFPEAQVTLAAEDGIDAFVLSAEQAVPMALVVTELIVNAMKHGDDAPVAVQLSATQRGARVAVVNRLRGVTRFEWGSGRGLGTGLELVSSLMLGLGEIVQSTTASELTMTMQLLPPVAA